jgi:hypothetical protein
MAVTLFNNPLPQWSQSRAKKILDLRHRFLPERSQAEKESEMFVRIKRISIILVPWMVQ